ncbi:MAG: hypothetical protein NTV34_03440 [Proteobacteria bacterium]|nr:hypothetical protein [Pseudomonadota bacterium]
MDVLYFIKEEYTAIRHSLRSFNGDDEEPILTEAALKLFLRQVEFVVRIAEELILPELADAATNGLAVIALATEQSAELGRIVFSSLKSGRMGESKRREFLSYLCSHISHMEQFVLPMFRVEIPTQAREELGLVARDFKGESFLELDRKMTEGHSLAKVE